MNANPSIPERTAFGPISPSTLTLLRERQPASLKMEDHERHVIACALLETFGNVSRASKLLGISRRTMHRAIARWPDLTPQRPTTKVEKQVRAWRRQLADLPAAERAKLAAEFGAAA